jgi:hypothetical protein
MKQAKVPCPRDKEISRLIGIWIGSTIGLFCPTGVGKRPCNAQRVERTIFQYAMRWLGRGYARHGIDTPQEDIVFSGTIEWLPAR